MQRNFIRPPRFKKRRQNNDRLTTDGGAEDEFLDAEMVRIKEENDINGLSDDEGEINVDEESAKVTTMKDVCLPCAAEIALHNLTHLPFRDWCPYCVQGKAVSYPHRKRKQDENEVPVISSDYIGQAS